MSEQSNLDRAAIRSRVEDHWRSFLSVARQNMQLGAQTLANFEQRIAATASLMLPEQSSAFLKAIEEEREQLANEYERNPDGLKRRLGLATDGPQPGIGYHHQQSLAEVAARTAVRATVWEAIFAFFRLFR